jgi:hypothetical protein
LRATDKLDYLNTPCPERPADTAPEAEKAAWYVEYKKYNVSCLMLTNMDAKLQKQFEYYYLYNMLEELKKSYEKTPTVELYDLLDQLHSCKHGDGKPVSAYVLMMKDYFDQLYRLNFGYPENVQVNLINRSLNKDFKGFVQNFNMHCSGKTLSELLAMLVDYEKGFPAQRKAPTPQVLAIQGGRIQKKSKAKKGKSKVDKGKQVMAYQPNPKVNQHQPKQNKVNPPNKKDQACHDCHEKGHWKCNCPLYIHDL